MARRGEQATSFAKGCLTGTRRIPKMNITTGSSLNAAPIAYGRTIIKVPTAREALEFGRPAVDATGSSARSKTQIRRWPQRIKGSTNHRRAFVDCFIRWGKMFAGEREIGNWQYGGSVGDRPQRASVPRAPVARGRRTRVLCSTQAESADLGRRRTCSRLALGLAFGARKPLWLW